MSSVVALSNTSGSIVETYSRACPSMFLAGDAFGNTTVCNASGTPRTPNASLYANPYMYTARRFDSETSLYYYRARIYSPTIGRFLQSDPIGYGDGMNMYAYCGNNPVNYVDPMGLKWENVTDLFMQWWHEAGPGHRDYTERSDEVEEIRNSPGVNAARDKFLKKNEERAEKGKPPKTVKDDYSFGPSGAVDAGLNPTRQFCGGYRVKIVPNSNGTKTITVSNDTNMRSFLYHAPGTKNYPRDGRSGIGGSMTQDYTWTEDYGYRGRNDNYIDILRNRHQRGRGYDEFLHGWK